MMTIPDTRPARACLQYFSIDDVWGHREFEQDARNRDRRRMWSEHRAALARLGVEQLQVGVVRKG
jgi:hypothetical protein